MSEFKIHAISDTHRSHIELTPMLTGGDLLIHAGDSDCFDELTTETFLRWYIKVAKGYKYGMILTGGNHDTYLAEFEEDVRSNLDGSDVHLLLNEEISLGGLKIFASPNSTTYGNSWTAFSGNEFELKDRVWNKIPEDLDILITHTPPFGILDSGHGSQSLLERLSVVKPKLHVFGHIHHGAGVLQRDGIAFANAAIIGTFDHRPFNPTKIVYSIKEKSVTHVSHTIMDVL